MFCMVLIRQGLFYVGHPVFNVWLPNFVGVMFRLCAARFALLVLVSWLVSGRWYWYGEVGFLKHKHQCALQLQTINMGLNKVSRALLVKLFFQNNKKSAVALREYRHIKEYGEVFFPYRG